MSRPRQDDGNKKTDLDIRTGEFGFGLPTDCNTDLRVNVTPIGKITAVST